MTYYFGHKIAEVEAVLGHHGTQDLSDWFGGFGFQAHRAVNGYQVQPRIKARINVCTDTKAWTKNMIFKGS